MRIILNFFLYPIEAIYYLVVLIRNFLYDSGLIKARRVKGKVISVGNISLGGTGKTPLVIFLAKYLSGRGHRVAVIMRGYRGSKSARMPFIVSDGESIYCSAIQCGDEAILIARKCKVPVVIGKCKVASAIMAVQKFMPEYIIVDDGFQHRKLYRDIDIVLVSPKDGTRLFPVGRLREPLSALKRASLIYVSKGEIKDLGFNINRVAATAPIEHLRLAITGWQINGDLLPKDKIGGKKVVVMAGIGDMNYFVKQIEELGGKVIRIFKYLDHHYYSEKDIEKVNRIVNEEGADLIATTEKDEVKLRMLNYQMNKVWIANLSVEVNEKTLDRFLFA
jgi:tetraacyldisaccharide 4'-kinase